MTDQELIRMRLQRASDGRYVAPPRLAWRVPVLAVALVVAGGAVAGLIWAL